MIKTCLKVFSSGGDNMRLACLCIINILQLLQSSACVMETHTLRKNSIMSQSQQLLIFKSARVEIILAKAT